MSALKSRPRGTLAADKICSEKHYRVSETEPPVFVLSPVVLLAFRLASGLLAELDPTARRKSQLRGIFQIQFFSDTSFVGIDRCDSQT